MPTSLAVVVAIAFGLAFVFRMMNKPANIVYTRLGKVCLRLIPGCDLSKPGLVVKDPVVIIQRLTECKARLSLEPKAANKHHNPQDGLQSAVVYPCLRPCLDLCKPNLLSLELKTS